MENKDVVILLEDFKSKLQWIIDSDAALLVEMQTMRRELREQFGELHCSLDILIKKLDAMTADVAADCADTETHVEVYRVKEPGV